MLEKLPKSKKVNLENLEKNENKEILEKQDLYKKIQEEISLVKIEEKDQDFEGNLLAPNGKISNLPEGEWKMARTPSFLEKFGNWKDKYNKEEYDLWLKYQMKQKLEDDLDDMNSQIYYSQKQTGFFKNEKMIEIRKKQKVIVNQNISKLHAELINNGFNIHSSSLDYTKALDENGEPLALYRASDVTPNEQGEFIVPIKDYYGESFQVGVFLGLKDEAMVHYEGRVQEGKEAHLYKNFVNMRNFRMFNSKPNYWDNPQEMKKLRNKYDGLWVNEYEKLNNETYNMNKEINLMDCVVFDPNNILIVGVK